MLRLTTILEELQGSERSNACLLKEQEAKTTIEVLARSGISYDLLNIEDKYLYNISIGTLNGGCCHELRTNLECVEIIQAQFPNTSFKDARDIFKAAATQKVTHHLGEITLTLAYTPSDEVLAQTEFFKNIKLANKGEIQEKLYDTFVKTIFTFSKLAAAKGSISQTKVAFIDTDTKKRIHVYLPSLCKENPGVWSFNEKTKNGPKVKVQLMHIQEIPEGLVNLACQVAQDIITDILLSTHEAGGAPAVHSLLRSAVANYACDLEKIGTELEVPNPTILNEAAKAILTPVYLQ